MLTGQVIIANSHLDIYLRLVEQLLSKKQSCVALSTAEAEYMALAGAAIWLRQLVTDVNNGPTKHTVI